MDSWEMGVFRRYRLQKCHWYIPDSFSFLKLLTRNPKWFNLFRLYGELFVFHVFSSLRNGKEPGMFTNCRCRWGHTFHPGLFSVSFPAFGCLLRWLSPNWTWSQLQRTIRSALLQPKAGMMAWSGHQYSDPQLTHPVLGVYTPVAVCTRLVPQFQGWVSLYPFPTQLSILSLHLFPILSWPWSLVS